IQRYLAGRSQRQRRTILTAGPVLDQATYLFFTFFARDSIIEIHSLRVPGLTIFCIATGSKNESYCRQKNPAPCPAAGRPAPSLPLGGIRFNSHYKYFICFYSMFFYLEA